MISAIRWSVPVATLVAALAGCGAKPAAKPDEGAGPKPVPVTVAPIERRTVERTVEAVGTLKGWEEVTLGAKRTGRVKRITHDMGDRVNPGEVLVELETADADLAIAQAQNSLVAQLEQVGLKAIPQGEFDVSAVPSVAQARLALEKSQQNLNRERSLRQRGAGTSQDFQNAEIDELAGKAALENAQLSVRAIVANALVSRAMFQIAQQQRADMFIKAPTPSHQPTGLKTPITYAIIKRSVSEGQLLREGDAVASLVVENPLRLWANVPESYANDVTIGQEVRVTVASQRGRAFVGKVSRINPGVDAASRTFQVEATIPNDEGKLRAGGFAKASIVTRRDDTALTVPIASILRPVGVIKLFVVESGNVAREVHVETGLEGKGWVEVIGKIPPEGVVVETGQSQLADGTPVVVRKPETAPAGTTAGTKPTTPPSS